MPYYVEIKDENGERCVPAGATLDAACGYFAAISRHPSIAPRQVRAGMRAGTPSFTTVANGSRQTLRYSKG